MVLRGFCSGFWSEFCGGFWGGILWCGAYGVCSGHMFIKYISNALLISVGDADSGDRSQVISYYAMIIYKYSQVIDQTGWSHIMFVCHNSYATDHIV